MKNLKVSFKLLLPHMVILLLLALGIIVSLASFMNIRKKIEVLYNSSYVIKNAAHTMDAALESMQALVFRSASNNEQDNTNEVIANTEDNEEIIQQQMTLIKQNFIGEMDIITRLENKLSQLEPMKEEVLYLVTQNKNAEAVEYMESNSIPVIKDTQKELMLLIQSAEINEKESINSLRATKKNTIFRLLSLGVVSVLFGIWGRRYIKQLHN